MDSRRRFLQQAAGLAAGGVLLPSRVLGADLGPSTLPRGTLDSALLEALTGKRPLIKRAYRPPNFETPTEYFSEAITPNDAFFVRYHLANIPQVDAKAWQLKIGGEGIETPY